jgi:hypothetical protein
LGKTALPNGAERTSIAKKKTVERAMMCRCSETWVNALWVGASVWGGEEETDMMNVLTWPVLELGEDGSEDGKEIEKGEMVEQVVKDVEYS